MEYIPNDLYSVVTRIVEDRLRYFRRYSGQVMRADPDGTAWVHSVEYGTDETKPESWIPCRPGGVNFNDMKPSVGDYMQFGFEDGTPDTPRYYAFSEQYLNLSTGSKLFIYTNEASITHDPNTGVVTITSGLQSISLDTVNGSVILSNAGSSIKVSASKITITSPNVEINGIDWISHGHSYLGGGLGDTTQKTGGAS